MTSGFLQVNLPNMDIAFVFVRGIYFVMKKLLGGTSVYNSV